MRRWSSWSPSASSGAGAISSCRTAGAAVELSLDEVDVVSHGRVVERFLELELELTRGSVADLAPLQALLDGHHGLTAAPGSKLERALLAARGGSSRQAVPAGRPVAIADRTEPSTGTIRDRANPLRSDGVDRARNRCRAPVARTADPDQDGGARAGGPADAGETG